MQCIFFIFKRMITKNPNVIGMGIKWLNKFRKFVKILKIKMNYNKKQESVFSLSNTKKKKHDRNIGKL